MESMLAQVVLVAIVTEFIVEGIKAKLPKIKEVKGWVIALVLAIGICISGKVYLLSQFGLELPSLLDAILTGAICSRGSSAIHEFLKRIKVEK